MDKIPNVVIVNFNPTKLIGEWETRHVQRTLHLLTYHAMGLEKYVYNCLGKLKNQDGRNSFTMGTAATAKAMFRFWEREVGPEAMSEEFCDMGWPWVAAALHHERDVSPHRESPRKAKLLRWKYVKPKWEIECLWCHKPFTAEADEFGKIRESFAYLECETADKTGGKHFTKQEIKKRRRASLDCCPKCSRGMNVVMQVKNEIKDMHKHTTAAMHRVLNSRKMRFELAPQIIVEKVPSRAFQRID